MTGGVEEAVDAALARELHLRFEPRRRALLDERVTRRRAGLATRRTVDGPDGDWTVSPGPTGLRQRVVELCAPADPEVLGRAMLTEVDVVMADLEDTLVPTWERVLAAHACLREHAAAVVAEGRPALVVRPRGLHLDEERVRVDGDAVSASLFDVATFLSGAAPLLLAAGARPHLYLPKIESASEAALWSDVLDAVEDALELEPGTVAVSVLVETVGGVVELDAIVYELRTRLTALNAGRWDYLFDFVRCAGHDTATTLPERGLLSMDLPFLVAYQRRIVEVAHRRGAAAIGGMAPAAPEEGAVGAPAPEVLRAVVADKRREASLGFDGAVVADAGMTRAVREAFAEAAGVASIVSGPTPVEAILDLGDTWHGPLAVSGLREAISVAVHYLDNWLAGSGMSTIAGRPEELSCVEIARALLWSWVQRGVALDDGTPLTAERFAAELATVAGDERRTAAGLLGDLVTRSELSDDVVPLAMTLIESS